MHTLPIKPNHLYMMEVIHEAIPRFGTFTFPDYMFSPTKKSDLGTFLVKGKIGSSLFNVFKEYQFYVEVINDPPEFPDIDKFLGKVEVI